MGKRESKGQQVKSFKHYVPGPDLIGIETIGKVYFKADDGLFYIYVPEHVTSYMPTIEGYLEGRYNGRAGYVSAPKMDDTIRGYEGVLAAYKRRRENEARVKMIRVEFAANHPERGTYTQGRLEGISFTGRPAIFLRHEVVWRVNDGLYHISDREMARAEKEGAIPNMHWVAAMPGTEHYRQSTQKTFVMDWTEEREAFFVKMHGDMEWLIEACMAMLFGDTQANVDKLIAGGGFIALGSPQAPALPAPNSGDPA
ncbi:hypothetical protein [Sphingomonas parapaucimobilis]|uniref:Uncharacterized protein n=1 Tax=Sphingomonas parapaucimobilis NBRC 15100 TaxID=1219049 RepID=A0A0A1W765_9SPHN|nr:hypothetical protein [Sphingomonas parapaucimobilis]GAM00744.1 hypothetical protein SP5_035_01460 [Sphingomonas parapaucimobilis NBRC 15100]